MAHTTAERGTEVRILSAVPTFLAEDVAATARWYVDNLGFTLAGNVPKNPPYVYASLMRDGAEIMLLSLAEYRKPDLSSLRPEGLWDAYFRMRGVNALYQQVKGEPFIKMKLKQQPYSDWEFEVCDPNGYVIVFGGEY